MPSDVIAKLRELEANSGCGSTSDERYGTYIRYSLAIEQASPALLAIAEAAMNISNLAISKSGGIAMVLPADCMKALDAALSQLNEVKL